MLFVICLLILLIIAIYFRSSENLLNRVVKVNSYFKNSSLILYITIFVSSIGSGSIIGLFDKLYNGEVIYAYAYIGSLLWFIFIFKYGISFFVKQQEIYTIGQIFKKYYGIKGQTIAGLASFIFSLTHMSAQIIAASQILSFIFKIDVNIISIICTILIFSYTFIGGLNSVIATDIVQYIIQIIAFFIFGYLAISQLDNSHSMEYFYNQDINVNDLLLMIVTFSIMTFYPNFIQRLLLIKDSKIIKRALSFNIVSYILLVLFILIMAINAQNMIIGHNYFKLHNFIDLCLNDICQAFAYIALLAALFSTADSDINSALAAASHDIFKLNYTNYSKIHMILIGVLSLMITIFLNLCFDNLLDLVIFISGLWSPIIVVPLIALMLNYKITYLQLISTITISFISFIFWIIYYQGSFYLKPVLIASLISSLCFIIFYNYNRLNSIFIK